MRSIKTLAWRPLQFLKSLISPSNITLAEPIAPEEPKAEEPATQASLDELNLSPRVFNCLWKSNIRNIETVASMSDENLLDIPAKCQVIIMMLVDDKVCMQISNKLKNQLKKGQILICLLYTSHAADE